MVSEGAMLGVRKNPIHTFSGLVGCSVSTRYQRRYFLTFKKPKNRFQGIDSACQYSLAGQYGNPIPTRFLAPIDCSKIPAVAPAVRVLSPARAPRGLHRALFMNSVSHGKIWTSNAASL
jgi:hypothetical protein